MNDFLVPLGWAYVAVSLLSLLGLFPRLASRIYPQHPPVLIRAAAPLLFAILAIACFGHVGLPALILVTVVGFKSESIVTRAAGTAKAINNASTTKKAKQRRDSPHRI